MQQTTGAAGAPPQTSLGTLQHSPHPLAGEEGAGCPSPKTPPPLSAFQASGFGPLGLASPAPNFQTLSEVKSYIRPCLAGLFTPTWGVFWGILTSKVGHADLVFGMQSGCIVDVCMQDYKSLCAAVMMCSTLVNIQTHLLTSLCEKLRQLGLKNQS